MLKAYKYRLIPNKEQREMINKHIGGCRFVYNWALETKIKYYQEANQKLSAYDLNYMLTELKNENEWLKDVYSQSLQQANKNMESAFTKFFREKAGFPKFKSKKNPVQSFQIPQHYKVNFDKNIIKLPKIGELKAVLHRAFEGKLKTATLSRTSTGKYFISILVDDGKEVPEKPKFTEQSTIGVDVGIKDFAVLSNGEKIDNPKYLKKSLKRLKVVQKQVSKKVKGSNNRKKAIKRLAKIHEKVTNQRTDFQHKVSSRLISENQAIAFETLKVKNMVKNHSLAQAINDASWSSFITKMEYKAEWYGKTILRIGQFEPSTKLCNVCGYHNKDITLEIREWVCPECKTKHDRDINAAINIKKFALQDQNLIVI
ncbi:IS200/IS605 family element RNA-guided endonuclease TnpB [Methanosarcina sp. Mfa9]|uniref:IS200/IS605 family element RNA-guided endonuclease TnpB n=1 Tax=Methanosarcina sp. Mfa9 TaxID=3439063 RepID=UPI003F87CF02